MLYFDKHPQLEYQFLGNTYEFIDIFRRNILKINSNFTTEYVLETHDTLESVSKKIYDDESYSWILALNNNVTSKENMPSLNQDIAISNKKIYSILDVNYDILFGDVVIRETDFSGFSLASDPYSNVISWDPLFRSMTVSERIPETDTSFSEGDGIIVLRRNLSNFSAITPTAGITLIKITSSEEFPISFSINGFSESPYLNVSGSGNTYISSTSTGTEFAKTLLYSYITDGISHSNYNQITEESKFKIFANNNISLNIPNLNIISPIEKEIEKTMSVVNKSRVFNITIR